MAREAAASGIQTVVCTPHLPDWDETRIGRIREVMEEVRAAVATAEIDLRLLLGFEVDLGVVATVDDDALRTLVFEGSDGAILLEMPYSGWPVFLEETIFRLSTNGFRPVLAHPERNDRVQRSSEPLMRCLRAGAVAQSTGASLTGEFGRETVQTFRRLLTEGWVSLLGSDAHAYRRDGWTFAPVLSALDGLVDEEGLATLVDVNPCRLLETGTLVPVSVTGNGGSWQWRVGRRKARRD